jgi:hypothetical protein
MAIDEGGSSSSVAESDRSDNDDSQRPAPPEITNPDSSASSDVDMDTDDEDGLDENGATAHGHQDDNGGGVIQQASAGGQSTAEAVFKKRKSPGASPSRELSEVSVLHETRKRVKLDSHDAQRTRPQSGAGPCTLLPGSDKSVVPREIWHHIFTLCPPRTLGRLLRVNRLFNAYLDPCSRSQRVSPTVPAPCSPSSLSNLKPNAIWRASRALCWPAMPAPLPSHTELDMWRLACSPRCQFCGKLDSRKSGDAQAQETLPDLFHSGPGSDGVSPLWAFAVRTCGPCLLEISIKVREPTHPFSSLLTVGVLPLFPRRPASRVPGVTSSEP